MDIWFYISSMQRPYLTIKWLADEKWSPCELSHRRNTCSIFPLSRRYSIRILIFFSYRCCSRWITVPSSSHPRTTFVHLRNATGALVLHGNNSRVIREIISLICIFSFFFFNWNFVFLNAKIFIQKSCTFIYRYAKNPFFTLQR